MAKVNNNLVTKTYLDKRLDQFGRKFKRELKEELREELKDDLYEIKDEIVGEIRDMREEFNAHLFSHERISDQLQDHEDRIVKLEP